MLLTSCLCETIYPAASETSPAAQTTFNYSHTTLKHSSLLPHLVRAEDFAGYRRRKWKWLCQAWGISMNNAASPSVANQPDDTRSPPVQFLSSIYWPRQTKGCLLFEEPVVKTDCTGARNGTRREQKIDPQFIATVSLAADKSYQLLSVFTVHSTNLCGQGFLRVFYGPPVIVVRYAHRVSAARWRLIFEHISPDTQALSN